MPVLLTSTEFSRPADSGLGARAFLSGGAPRAAATELRRAPPGLT